MEKRGIVESSNSVWLNPVVLRRKKSGELRFCVDFRKLNQLVELDGFPLPSIQELVTSLRGKKLFTVLDLKDGFFQIPIHLADREKTAFLVGSRLMQFCRMPQGYKNSPSIFQRAMTQILQGLLGEHCLVYIDDILVFGKDEEEHDRNLERVLKRLKEYALVENRLKRKYKQEEVEFLGYIVGRDRLKPKTERAQGIMGIARPKTRKELQRFLGALNYDRTFFPGFSEKAKPLYELLKKEIQFAWTEEHDNAFQNLKNQWTSELELMMPIRLANSYWKQTRQP